jgi:hypothetical protein
VELSKDVLDAILRKVQQSESNFDSGPLDLIYGKAVINRHLLHLIEVHLIEGKVLKGVSPPVIVVQGLTAAGQLRLGIAESGSGMDSD